MTLREAIDRYVALRQAAGADFPTGHVPREIASALTPLKWIPQ